MEAVREGLIRLREELGMRQTDLAAAVGVSAVTVNRWETGKNPPNRAMSLAILAYAKTRGVSALCLEALKAALLPSAEQPGLDDLKLARVEQINSLVNDSSNGVMVCDAQTHELLYVNRRMGDFTGRTMEEAAGRRCYEYVFGRRSPCEQCPIPQCSTTAYYTAEHTSSVTGRSYMTRSRLIDWSGRRAHIEYITDLTSFRAVCEELRRSHGLMTLACQEAGLWMFSLELPSGTARVEPVVQKALGLPPQVPDFLQEMCRRGAVLPEYAAQVQNVLHRLQAGETPVTLEVQTEFLSSRVHWVRLRAQLLPRGEQIGPGCAVCSAQIIDNEKALEARIRFEHEQIIDSRPDVMGYSVFDLTRNVLLEQRRLLDVRPPQAPGTAYDEAIGRTAAFIEPPEDRARFIVLHDRSTLLEQFAQGTVQQRLDFQLHQADGSLMWVRDELRLMLEPVDGHVLLYEYCFASHDAKLMAGLLAAAMTAEHELMGAVTLPGGQMTTLAFSQEGDPHRTAFDSYAQGMEDYCRKHLPACDWEAFLRCTEAAAIRAKLRTRKTCSVIFRMSGPGGRGKVIRYSRADEAQQLCLVAVMDLERLQSLLTEEGDTNEEARE